MAKEYTTKDTLNSISWQLKRIAEALESIDERQHLNQPQSNFYTNIESTKLRELLEQAKSNHIL